MATWTDDMDCYTTTIGEIGFLRRIVDENRAMNERYQLTDRPPVTNQSHEPTLRGWCGSFNGVNTYGEGLAKVSRVTKNGRVLLTPVAKGSPEEDAALEALGYPDID